MIIKPMLLSKFSKSVFNSVDRWYVSEKYDGWRLIYSNKKFYTRQGNEILLDPKMYRDLEDIPDDIILDGELWSDYSKVGEVASLGKDLKFLVFDLINDQPFSQRLKTLKKLIVPGKRIKLVDHKLISSDGNYPFVEELLSEVTARDGEGLVFRRADQLYQTGARPSDFLKLKKMDTTEVEVVGYYTTPAKKASEGPDYISSLVCDYQGSTFKLNWRAFIAPPIGKIITIKFSQFTINGLPKFPVYVSERDSREYIPEKPKKVKKVVKRKPKQEEPLTEMSAKDWAILEYPLEIGESVGVVGTTETWKVTKTRNGSIYCNCPAWLYQRMPAIQRTCKHTRIFAF
jgi:DNA ligase-1